MKKEAQRLVWQALLATAQTPTLEAGRAIRNATRPVRGRVPWHWFRDASVEAGVYFALLNWDTGKLLIAPQFSATFMAAAEAQIGLGNDAPDFRAVWCGAATAALENLPIEKIRVTVGRLGEESLPLLRRKWPKFSFELDRCRWQKEEVLVICDQESVRAEAAINTNCGLLTISLL
jgi:hypothetical protein